MWLDPNGSPSQLSDIISLIDDGCDVFVGSDSQRNSDCWIFATVICLYWQGRGGRYFFRRKRLNHATYSCLEDRLLSEVYDSVMIADEIRQTKPNLQISVHADIGSSASNRSNKIAKLAQSYIIGMGFSAAIKPDAWAAASIADKLTR